MERSALWGRRGVAMGVVSLALLLVVPILPGMGSLLAMTLGLLARRQAPRWHWMPVAATLLGGVGLAFALAQALTALSLQGSAW